MITQKDTITMKRKCLRMSSTVILEVSRGAEALKI